MADAPERDVVEQLQEAAQSIRADGTPAQVGLSADEHEDIAREITRLRSQVAGIPPQDRQAVADELKLVSAFLFEDQADGLMDIVERAIAMLQASPSPPVGEEGRLGKHAAYWTHEECDAVGHLYYFGIQKGVRTRGPYTNQRHVKAIVDIAHDGTLAGIELIDNMPPPPPGVSPPVSAVVQTVERRGEHLLVSAPGVAGKLNAMAEAASRDRLAELEAALRRIHSMAYDPEGMSPEGVIEHTIRCAEEALGIGSAAAIRARSTAPPHPET
jgi:hypothetical protein